MGCGPFPILPMSKKNRTPSQRDGVRWCGIRLLLPSADPCKIYTVFLLREFYGYPYPVTWRPLGRTETLQISPCVRCRPGEYLGYILYVHIYPPRRTFIYGREYLLRHAWGQTPGSTLSTGWGSLGHFKYSACCFLYQFYTSFL